VVTLRSALQNSVRCPRVNKPKPINELNFECQKVIVSKNSVVYQMAIDKMLLVFAWQCLLPVSDASGQWFVAEGVVIRVAQTQVSKGTYICSHCSCCHLANCVETNQLWPVIFRAILLMLFNNVLVNIESVFIAYFKSLNPVSDFRRFPSFALFTASWRWSKSVIEPIVANGTSSALCHVDIGWKRLSALCREQLAPECC